MASVGYEFGAKLGWRVWLWLLQWPRWWNRHSTGQVRQCGRPGFSLPVVPGPLREVLLRRPQCALLLGHSGRLCDARCPTVCVPRGSADSVSSLYVLVLEVPSHHFCCSHTFAQVGGGGNVDLTHLLQARVPVGHTVRRSREMGESVVSFRK